MQFCCKLSQGWDPKAGCAIPKWDFSLPFYCNPSSPLKNSSLRVRKPSWAFRKLQVGLQWEGEIAEIGTPPPCTCRSICRFPLVAAVFSPSRQISLILLCFLLTSSREESCSDKNSMYQDLNTMAFQFIQLQMQSLHLASGKHMPVISANL